MHIEHPFSALIATAFLASLAGGAAAQQLDTPMITAAAINAARIDGIAVEPLDTRPALPVDETMPPPPDQPDAAIARLQVLLDRQGASPGVIDGFEGENVRKAIVAIELMHALPPDGTLDADVIEVLETGEPVIGSYVITAEDLEQLVAEIPSDYAAQAELEWLGYTSVPERLAERFHMDIKLLMALNPGAGFSAGDAVFVAGFGLNREDSVTRIEADKSLRQVRAYNAEGELVVAYPATIGSEDNPSPSGTHEVLGVALDPTYTYNPEINFQQGENTDVLVLPPGPNGPVGSVWIDLSEPTYGIHGTPQPSLIDKTGSHGCVRLTNWDAAELAGMISPGVIVEFID